MAYFNIYGNIVCNGQIGNGSTFDAVGFNFEGTEQSISGSGQCNLGRVRKFGNTNLSTTLTVNGHASILFPGLGSLYNSADNTRFNLTISETGTLEITDPASSIAIDGFDGISTGQRGGLILVQGRLICQGVLYAKNNNTSNTQPTFGTGFIVGSTGSAQVQNLECDILSGKGTTVAVAPGGKLFITGVLTVTSGAIDQQGSLIIRSNSSGTARIANSGGSITGTVTSERYITNQGWHFTGTVVGGQTIVDWNDDFQTQGPMPGVRVYNPGSNTSSIFEFDQTYGVNLLGEINGWKVPTVSSLNQYKGYRVYIPSGTTLDNTGSYNMNPSSINLQNTGSSSYAGWNLVMNPHLSAVSLSGFVFGSNVQQTVVIWNPVTNSYQYTGQLGGLTGVTLNNSITPIASGQAFFVKCTAPSTLTIPQSAKATTSGSFFRTATEQSSPNALEIRIKNVISEFDATLFQFVDGSEYGYETAYDASKVMNPGLNVYTKINGDNYAINAIPSGDESVIVGLGYSTGMPGIHGFQFDGLNILNGYNQVYLRDLMNGTITEITSSDTYTFNTESGEFGDRFEIIFTNSVTAIEDIKVNESVKIYPNPVFSDEVTVNTLDNSGDINVVVTDIIGRVVTNKTFNGGEEIKFNKPSRSGQYFVKVKTPKTTVTKTLSVK
jgi:hypothetical protein